MKKILLSSLIGFVGILSFCSAGSYTFEGDGTNFPSIITPPQIQVNKNITLNCTFTYTDCGSSNAGLDIFKVKFRFSYYTNSSSSFSAWGEDISSELVLTCGGSNTLNFSYDFSTFTPAQTYYQYHGVNLVALQSVYMANPSIIHYSCTFSGDYITNGSSAGGGSASCPECPSCPGVNTGEILSGYILESEIDTNYCVSNNLCSENTGNSASWSELVINDVVHQSAPLININIPEEFDWSYTVDENEFDLGISGYNVDTDYIDGIITAQTVKPNSGDFNKIITELIPLFVPGLVIILFLRFVFKFIKKIF